MGVIQLFVLDIDGCITYPFTSPDWKAVSEIRELNLQSRKDPSIPTLTICTGRPLPYAEAVAQWLDIRLPFVFESAALYQPDTSRIFSRYNSPSTDGHGADNRNGSLPRPEYADQSGSPAPATEALKPIREFRRWMTEDLLPDYPNAMLEFSKMFDAGVVSPDPEQIDRIYMKILDHTQNYYPDLEVHRTDVSVNTLLAGNNKGVGFELISQELDVSLDQMAYIGDSEGDLMPLRRVKMPFAPSNAILEVQEISETIKKETSGAVLEAYRRIIKRNREQGD